MARMSSVDVVNDTPVLRVGKAAYKVVIVSNMLTIRPTTLALLREFMDKGGKVIFCGDVPAYVDAISSNEPAELAKQGITVPYDEYALIHAVWKHTDAFVRILDGEGGYETAVFAQVRKSFGGDGYAVVVLNTDREHPRKDMLLSLKAPVGYTVEEWDLETGERLDASALAISHDEGYSIALDLEAAGTRCFVLTKTPEALPAVTAYETVAAEFLTGASGAGRDRSGTTRLRCCGRTDRSAPIWVSSGVAVRCCSLGTPSSTIRTSMASFSFPMNSILKSCPILTCSWRESAPS